MSNSKSHQEVEQEYVAKMGPDLGPLLHALSTELSWTYWRWGQARILFADKPRRVELLNEAAPVFFGIVQDVLVEETLLAIARLAGPARSVGKDNLSIAQLPPLVADPALRGEVEGLIDKAVAAGAFAKPWRNRRVAHRDLDLALRRGGAPPLPPASRPQIEDALSAIADVLNRVEREFCDSTTAYAWPDPQGGAEDLLYIVRDGLARNRERRERLERGEPNEDDLRGRAPV